MTAPSHGDVSRTPGKGPPAHAPNAALLIDFDNVTMGIRSDLQSELRRLLESDIIRGKVAVQRAYADWRRYPQYIVPLSESSIDLIFAPAVGPNKKNATDIRLAIDALELVFTRPEIGTYILLSGDSDFSGLVLKLKEYGKYVIGVGFRESSSDMLIQNCDEYYSYTDIAGFVREGDIHHVRRDPWELVVEALVRMHRSGDAMRSDRLKQVMQRIDPNFTEKDAGFSRFSRFVHEASTRGLVAVQKLDNGQLDVSLGPDANADIVGDDELPPPPSRTEVVPVKEEVAAVEPEAIHTLELADGFALLRRALKELGADTETPVTADAVLERMTLLHGNSDPILERRKFAKFLRQAHDASVLDVRKTEEGGYELCPLPDETDQIQPPEDEKPKKTKAAPRKRATRSRKSTPAPVEAPDTPASVAPDDSPAGKGSPGDEIAEEPAAADPAQPSPVKRRASRGRTATRSKQPQASGSERSTTNQPGGEKADAKEPGSEDTGTSETNSTRTARSRGGARTPKAAAPTKEEPTAKPASDAPAASPASTPSEDSTAWRTKRSPRFRSGSRSARKPTVSKAGPETETVQSEIKGKDGPRSRSEAGRSTGDEKTKGTDPSDASSNSETAGSERSGDGRTRAKTPRKRAPAKKASSDKTLASGPTTRARRKTGDKNAESRPTASRESSSQSRPPRQRKSTSTTRDDDDRTRRTPETSSKQTRTEKLLEEENNSDGLLSRIARSLGIGSGGE